MLTKKQNWLYWREWNSVVGHCKSQNLECPDRHALHITALGYDKPHALFTNPELDKVLAEFRARFQPANLSAQIRQLSQPRIRLIHSIRHHELGQGYWRAIAQNRFNTTDLDSLSDHQLEQLRNTLASRANAKRRQAAPETADTPF